MLKKFLDANRRLSARIERCLPASFKAHMSRTYEQRIAEILNRSMSELNVVDVGGGKHCPYLRFVDPERSHRYVAIDVDPGELARNGQIRDRVAADVVFSFPFSNSSVDVLTSRSVVEHLTDVDRFLGNCARVVKPGGYVIHSFPCKFTPFSVVNQLLPSAFSRRLLHFFHPAWQDHCGFKAYYDRCYYSGMIKLLRKHNFSLIYEDVRYYQAIYYDFFFPLYGLMIIYDLLIWKLKIKDFSCQMLFVARRDQKI